MGGGVVKRLWRQNRLNKNNKGQTNQATDKNTNQQRIARICWMNRQINIRLNAELNILGKEKTKEPQQLKLTLRGLIKGHKINK